ncbi:MAG: urease accessory protein UreD, urease accessory protein [Candidatus Rokubacteria bacterium CSP1-6]|nr:MAG: urease accessory protein UreD, urease accessory protein [Candidatus Rokubacteria bacterium CSP1-6]
MGPALLPSSTGSAPAFSSTPDRVGRDGALALAFERRGGGTVLTARRFTLPLQALEPIPLEGAGSVCLTLLNPTGGVLGGDRLEAEIAVGPGAHVCLTTPSATRVYRALGPPAVQETSIRLGVGATVEYIPDHVIPHPGSVFHQSLTVEMGPGSRVILSDALAIGRLAREERWAFRELVSRISVTSGGRPLFLDRIRLDPSRRIPQELGGMERFGYLASLALFADGFAGWEDVICALEARLAAWPSVLGGVSLVAGGGCLVRFLAPSAQDLTEATRGLWALARHSLLGLPALDLRKW